MKFSRRITRQIGKLALAGGVYLLSSHAAYANDDQKWLLPSFSYSELSNDYIYVTGSLIGEDIGYPYNTYSIRCGRDEQACEVANVSEIGSNRLDSITMVRWPVISWSDEVVVLQDQIVPKNLICIFATITINRKSHSVSYVSSRINSKKDLCRAQGFTEDKTYYWHIGNPKQ